jgi:hypothetical protein
MNTKSNILFHYKMNDENGHSQFLAQIIKTHPIYRQLFLHYVLSSNVFSKESNVTFEEKADNGRIDLLLLEGEKAFIIENKINAIDQPQQLQRYYDWAIKTKKLAQNDVSLYYLTPLGSNPMPESLSQLEISQIHIISYSHHIIPWLDRCIEKNLLFMRDALIDYKEQWTVYLNKHYYRVWNTEIKKWYDIFKEISLFNFPHLVYIDEPLNESHILLTQKQGALHIKFEYFGKEVKLIYDVNNDVIFLRMATVAFDVLDLDKSKWKLSEHGYDYSIFQKSESDKSESEIVQDIIQTLESLKRNS